MRLSHIFAVLFVLCAVPAFAQTPAATPTSALGWNEAAPTVAAAQGYTYSYIPDGGVPIILTPASVVCSGAVSPFACQAPFPAFTPTSHTIALIAGNGAGDSLPSTPLAFTFVVIPSAPTNVRIVGGD